MILLHTLLHYYTFLINFLSFNVNFLIYFFRLTSKFVFTASIACQDLSEHVPDYRFISAHFRAASHGGKGNGTRSSNAAQTAAAQQSAALANNPDAIHNNNNNSM